MYVRVYIYIYIYIHIYVWQCIIYWFSGRSSNMYIVLISKRMFLICYLSVLS